MSGTHSRQKSQRVSRVAMTRYGGSQAIHSDVNKLVNDRGCTKKRMRDGVNGDRCTVIISVPKNWGGSFGQHPGHAGVVLWNSVTFQYQSFGILMDGSFADEEVNAHHDTIKQDRDFLIWYFTQSISAAQYTKMQNRMFTLGTKRVGYGKVLVARGWSSEGSYSCVTAVDTILVAGGLSWAVASMSSTPYAYAQTFTRVSWDSSYADGYKHM